MTESARRRSGRNPEASSALGALTTPGEGGTPGEGPAPVTRPPVAPPPAEEAAEPAVVAPVPPPAVPRARAPRPATRKHSSGSPAGSKKRRRSASPKATNVLGNDPDGEEYDIARGADPPPRPTTTTSTTTTSSAAPRPRPPKKQKTGAGFAADELDEEALAKLRANVTGALNLQEQATRKFRALNSKERAQINEEAFGAGNALSDEEGTDDASEAPARSRRRPPKRRTSAGQTPFHRAPDTGEVFPPPPRSGAKLVPRPPLPESDSDESEPEPAQEAPRRRQRTTQPDFADPDSEGAGRQQGEDDGKDDNHEEKTAIPPSRPRRRRQDTADIPRSPTPPGTGKFPPLRPPHLIRAERDSAAADLRHALHRKPTHSEDDDPVASPPPGNTRARGKKRSTREARREDREWVSSRSRSPQHKRQRVPRKPKKIEVDPESGDDESSSARDSQRQPSATSQTERVDLTDEPDEPPRPQPIFTLKLPDQPREWLFEPTQVHRPKKLRYSHYLDILEFVNKGKAAENIVLPRTGLLFRYAARSRLGSAQRAAWINGHWHDNTGMERTSVIPAYSILEMDTLRRRHEQGSSIFICPDRRPKVLPSPRSYPLVRNFTVESAYARWAVPIKAARRQKKKGGVVQYLIVVSQGHVDQHKRQVLHDKLETNKAWIKLTERTLFLAFKFGALYNIECVDRATDLSPADRCWRTYFTRFVDTARVLADHQAELVFQQAVVQWLLDNQVALEEHEAVHSFQKHSSNFFALTDQERKQHGWDDPDGCAEHASGKRRSSSRRQQKPQSESEPECEERRKPSRRRERGRSSDDRKERAEPDPLPSPPPSSDDDGDRSSSPSPSPSSSRGGGSSRRRKKERPQSAQRDIPDCASTGCPCGCSPFLSNLPPLTLP